MNAEWYEVTIMGLALFVAVLVLLLAWLSGQSIAAVRDSIPPTLMPVLEMLIAAGIEGSRRTATPVDDQAFLLMARSLGFTVTETAGGGIKLERIPALATGHIEITTNAAAVKQEVEAVIEGKKEARG